MSFSTRPLQVDPRALLILLVLANVIAFTYQQPYIEFIVIGLLALLQALCGCGRTAIKWIILFTVLVLGQYYLLPIMPKYLAVMMVIFTVYLRKIFPCFMVGSLILQTTPVRHLLVALHRWHIPQSVTIPLAVTIRYFPAIHEEYRHIKDAMKLKHIKGIANKLECTMVPLLVSAIQTSDELSAAAITRGIENPAPKTSIVDLRFHIQDLICLAIAIALACYTVFIG